MPPLAHAALVIVLIDLLNLSDVLVFAVPVYPPEINPSVLAVPTQETTVLAVARVPGVSIRREGGEGNKVVIRGLSPKYNKITVNGTKTYEKDLIKCIK